MRSQRRRLATPLYPNETDLIVAVTDGWKDLLGTNFLVNAIWVIRDEGAARRDRLRRTRQRAPARTTTPAGNSAPAAARPTGQPPARTLSSKAPPAVTAVGTFQMMQRRTLRDRAVPKNFAYRRWGDWGGRTHGTVAGQHGWRGDMDQPARGDSLDADRTRIRRIRRLPVSRRLHEQPGQRGDRSSHADRRRRLARPGPALIEIAHRFGLLRARRPTHDSAAGHRRW